MKPPELVQTILDANCGMCRAEHLIRCGADHGFTVDDLRTASVSLGVVGVTVGGQRYVSLPSHAKRLEPWAQYHASVMDYHRLNRGKEQHTDAIELDDPLPTMQ